MPYRGEIVDLESKMKSLKCTQEFNTAHDKLQGVQRKLEMATNRRKSEIQMRKESILSFGSNGQQKLNIKQELADKEY